MRAAAAALPEPRSATTSMGTSFCDSSRITASTVRMPALTLSTQTRPLSFDEMGGARSSVLSRSILFCFAIPRPKTAGGEVLGNFIMRLGAHLLPIRWQKLCKLLK